MVDIKEITSRIEAAIDTVRPFLQADGGDIKLLEITDDMVARFEFLGACSNCSMKPTTFKAGVEGVVKKAAPEIVEVIAVNM